MGLGPTARLLVVILPKLYGSNVSYPQCKSDSIHNVPFSNLEIISDERNSLSSRITPSDNPDWNSPSGNTRSARHNLSMTPYRGELLECTLHPAWEFGYPVRVQPYTYLSGMICKAIINRPNTRMIPHHSYHFIFYVPPRHFPTLRSLSLNPFWSWGVHLKPSNSFQSFFSRFPLQLTHW